MPESDPPADRSRSAGSRLPGADNALLSLEHASDDELRASGDLHRGIRQAALNSTSQVLSLDETGQYALVQTIQFGWLRVGGPDPGRFTPLPGFPPGQEAFWAAW